MKRVLCFFAAWMMVFCCCATAEEMGSREVAPYMYDVGDGGQQYLENLVFPADVVISGERGQIVFSNCLFLQDIILTSSEGTRVLLLGCEVLGECALENDVLDADMEYNNPKFLTDGPVSVRIGDGVGSAIALGDFAIRVNGEAVGMGDSQLFWDLSVPEGGYVPYEGQQASYYCVAQWYEAGEKIQMILCEFDPAM